MTSYLLTWAFERRDGTTGYFMDCVSDPSISIFKNTTPNNLESRRVLINMEELEMPQQPTEALIQYCRNL